ncbi:class I SAM-dependent methyltransferase [Roseovarius faecimaris]|uniref:Class I SAM-dependent methyltransferase n=1 Tax=Roseovarius faecimaris TaxID=2494550 RepID=A0A6I6J4R5_9RHOB|nr:class I SAM-dependent methyltransferase [Roseovarius faecimaris]QGX99748.1 class I SAM-dependent methyltransferase [Roseovarius faecimaris]
MTEHDKSKADRRLTDYVRQFHDTFDGSFPEVPTSLGPSSYELLANEVSTEANDGAPVVLDLGCGTGRLLEILTERGIPPENLIGVDFSPEQINRARSRFADMPVRLHICEAHNLPLLDDTVDYVLAHMSLAVMKPIEKTLREIHRVLGPGGVLAVVLGDEPASGSIEGHYSRILSETIARHQSDPLSFESVDTQTAPRETLADTVRRTTGMQEVVPMRPFELMMQMSGAEYIAFLEGDYLYQSLSDPARREVVEAVSRLFDAHGENSVDIPLTMQLAVFAKPAAVADESGGLL